MQDLEQKYRVYDIANSGPRNRFVVSTKYGPLLVHNCILGLGYSSGKAVLQRSLRNGFIRVDLPIEETERIVNLYRSMYSMIPRMWKVGAKVLDALYEGYNLEFGVGCKILADGSTSSLLLPNGMRIRFPDLKREQGQYGWEYTYRKRKLRERMYGPKVIQNVIQALARIIVAYQMCAIKKWLETRSLRASDSKIRRVVHMVHDEVVVIVPDDEAESTKQAMERIMSTPLSWAQGLPVACEAGLGKTYGDAK